MKNIFVVLFMIFTGLTFGQNNDVKSPKIAIKIPLGEAITLKNHVIKFTEVLEDSRCPENMTCVWAGRARVLLEISENGKKSINKTLIFGKVNKGESDDKELFSYNNSKVNGLSLSPYPNSKEAVEGAPYILLVYLEN